VSSLADARRLSSLRAVTPLLDHASQVAFDRVARLVAELAGTPIAAVSLIDERRRLIREHTGCPSRWPEYPA